MNVRQFKWPQGQFPMSLEQDWFGTILWDEGLLNEQQYSVSFCFQERGLDGRRMVPSGNEKGRSRQRVAH